MLKEHQIKILMLVHELEKALGDLYLVFSERFPEYNTLWNVLIKEEHAHAEAVRKLYQLTYEGHSMFDEGNIKIEAVQAIVDFLKSTYNAASRGKFSAAQAISTTHDIEKSLIEKDIFSHFRVSPQYADMLEFLKEGTHQHIQLAKKELDKFKNTPRMKG